jgi:hypothetical protein
MVIETVYVPPDYTMSDLTNLVSEKLQHGTKICQFGRICVDRHGNYVIFRLFIFFSDIFNALTHTKLIMI